MKYIPLNVKTEYDLMNSLIKIDELISYAKNNELKYIGISDTNMFSSYEFISKCKDENIKGIIGIELILDESKIWLYARNFDGFISLCKIVSKKNIEENIDIDYISKLDNLILVCSYNDYQKYNSLFEFVFIKYENEKEKNNALLLSENVLYFPCIKYFNKEDIEYFKYLKYIEQSKTIDESIELDNNYMLENNNMFDIETTRKFSSLINIEFPKSRYHIPVYKENSFDFLKALSKKGLEKRLNGNVPDKYKNRLIYELNVIESMHYVDYFLIVYDFILFAKKHNILVGPGRGSGAASLVNYALGIINVDPLKYDLIFERFLNPDRITMPDIDIDFDNLKREEVIEYVTNKYGVDKTARIISFNTMAPKQVIRDIGRVLKTNDILIDRLCKTIRDEKDFNELKNNYEFMNIYKHNSEVSKLIKICSHLCGLKKNTSVHAAGVVISDIPLNTIMPLYKSNNMILTGYSMNYIESLGLLKMDFLSIKNLNTISNIIDDIKNDGININIDKIDLNDKKTLDLFKNAYTTGVFQFESDGMRNFLKDLEVDSFNTLVDAIALYRPGPRDMIPEYIARKKKIHKVTYLIKELEPILKSTYGIIIYQEQVLEILRSIGGFSYAHADIVRRAMSKKKFDVIENEKNIFIEGVKKHGYDEKVGIELYNLIIKFASYGFNKSHSVVYSLVAFQMAYLKVNYAIYFMKNLLNMNSSSEKIKEYIDESKILGIEFEPISINESSYNFKVSNGKLRLPFSIIKSIASNVSLLIEEERSKGKFKSFYDFMIRCYHGSVNKKVVCSLILAGAFDEFKINKKQIINNIDEVINYISLCKDLNVVLDNPPVFDNISDYDDKELTTNELSVFGFYLSFHPVTKYDRTASISLDKFKNYFNKTITLILYVESTKIIKTKNNENMMFVKFSDEFDTVEGVIFPDAYKKINEVEKNNVYKVNANVERRNNTYQLIVYNMILLK